MSTSPTLIALAVDFWRERGLLLADSDARILVEYGEDFGTLIEGRRFINSMDHAAAMARARQAAAQEASEETR